jgi:excisionase family DNA binding protein
MNPTPRPPHEPHALLTPGEAAGLLRVHPKTVTRYVHEGKLPASQTPGGHHRFYRVAIDAVLMGLNPWDACATHGLPLPPRPTNPTT